MLLEILGAQPREKPHKNKSMGRARAKAVPAAAREGQPAGMHTGGPQQDTREGTLGSEILSCRRKKHSWQYQHPRKMLRGALHLIPDSLFLPILCLLHPSG